MSSKNKIQILKALASLILVFVFIVPLFTPLQLNFKKLFFLPSNDNSYAAHAVLSGPNLFCTSGTVICGNGGTPSCPNALFVPKCLSGFVTFIECCQVLPFSIQCDPNMPISCTSTTSSSSSSSSTSTTSSSSSSGSGSCTSGTGCTGGLVPNCILATENFYCINGLPNCVNKTTFDKRTPSCILPACTSGAFCTSGTVHNCNPSVAPFVCIGGVGNIPCCFNVMTTQCTVPICSIPQCSSGAFCQSGSVPDCSSGEVFSCINGGSIDNKPCCYKATTGVCRTPNCLASSSSSSSSSSGGGSRIAGRNAFIVSTPELPIVYMIEAEDGVGYAYVGSNPSFEITYNNSDKKEIVSVDLQDSKGVTYSNLSFEVTNVVDDPTKILTLSLPSRSAEGETKLALNLTGGSTAIAEIELIAPLEIKALRERSPKAVNEPEVKRVTATIRGKELTLNFKGKNFVGRGFLYEENSSTKVFIGLPKNSNTYVTLYPSNLDLDLVGRTVSTSGRRMKVVYNLNNKLFSSINSVLVIATPKGIVSKQVEITP